MYPHMRVLPSYEGVGHIYTRCLFDSELKTNLGKCGSHFCLMVGCSRSKSYRKCIPYHYGWKAHHALVKQVNITPCNNVSLLKILNTSLLKKKTTVSLQLVTQISYSISHPHAIHFPHKTIGASTTYLVKKTNLIPPAIPILYCGPGTDTHDSDPHVQHCISHIGCDPGIANVLKLPGTTYPRHMFGNPSQMARRFFLAHFCQHFPLYCNYIHL